MRRGSLVHLQMRRRGLGDATSSPGGTGDPTIAPSTGDGSSGPGAGTVAGVAAGAIVVTTLAIAASFGIPFALGYYVAKAKYK